MNTLSKNWLTEGIIDFEYKKYILLAYLQKVKEQFATKKLYPDFSDLIDHFKYLRSLKEQQINFEQSVKKSMTGFDFKNLSLVYDQTSINEEWINEIKEIIDYSLPLMAEEVMEGKTIFDFAEQNIYLQHVGLLPVNKKEGYFLLQKPHSKKVKVYNYSLSPITFMDETAFGLKTEYFSTFTLTIAKPIDSIKQELIYINPYLPNPAVYYFKSKISLPLEETYLPIAKRLLFNALTAST